MKLDTIAATLKAQIQALAAAPRNDCEDELAALPYDYLENDYRRDPAAACRKALRLTRSIARPARRLRAIDRLLGMHGVESVRLKSGHHAFSFANTGDSYACTVVLFNSGAFRVTSWGVIVERNSSRYA